MRFARLGLGLSVSPLCPELPWHVTLREGPSRSFLRLLTRACLCSCPLCCWLLHLQTSPPGISFTLAPQRVLASICSASFKSHLYRTTRSRPTTSSVDVSDCLQNITRSREAQTSLAASIVANVKLAGIIQQHMDDKITMGAGCGQKSADAAPAELTPEATQAYTRPAGIKPQAATVEDANEEEEPSSSHELNITSPPSAIPRPKAGMSLPAWLKLLIKAEEGSAVDQFVLLEAYHLLFPQPHASNEAFSHILRKIFTGAVEADEPKSVDGRLWLIHVRWLNAAEAAMASEAGHGASKRHVVSNETRKNAARVMDFLLTAGGEKLVVRPRVSGEGVNVDAKKPFPAGPGTPMPPPPPPAVDMPIQPMASLQAPRPRRDLAREFQTIKDAPSFANITCWLREVLISDKESEVDTFDITHAYKATHAGDTTKPHIDATLMGGVVMHVFGNEDTRSLEEFLCQNNEIPTIAGVRWRKLETPTSSTAIAYQTFPERSRNEVRAVL